MILLDRRCPVLYFSSYNLLMPLLIFVVATVNVESVVEVVVGGGCGVGGIKFLQFASMDTFPHLQYVG